MKVIGKYKTSMFDDFLILQDENNKYYRIWCHGYKDLTDLPVSILTKEEYIKYYKLC